MQNCIKTSYIWRFLQLPKISNDTGEAFTAPMRELVNKYADVFTKPRKPVARDIKHKIELLNPANPILHHKAAKNK